MIDPTNPITYFAETDARNKKMKFGIKAKDRLKHMYIIGKTGMGKSTLLENMAIQDIQNGEGLAFVDPHGGAAEKLLDYVPEHRIKDVLYFAPFDMEYPVAFNVMEDVDPDKRHLVVNGLMATFEKIWADAWSARMAYILQYAILALLEYPDSTILGINRMLSDKEYRKKVVDNITDTSAKSFWIDEFGKYTERFAAEATPAIQNKVGQFISSALVRNIIGQPRSSFDIRQMMDQKKILIINLSKGQVGELNAKLLGSMLITKIYLAAMSRADLSEVELNKKPNFYLYVDEFQSFANKSFADILSEARKYKLNLTIAHQYIEQMEEEVRDAVFGNVGTMITFRIGAFDAEVLEKEFAPVFTAEDLVNLGFAQIYLKLMIDGVSSQPFSAVTLAPIVKPEISFRERIIESSRKIFGRPRKNVEENITKFYNIAKSQFSQPQVSFSRPLGPEKELTVPSQKPKSGPPTQTESQKYERKEPVRFEPPARQEVVSGSRNEFGGGPKKEEFKKTPMRETSVASTYDNNQNVGNDQNKAIFAKAKEEFQDRNTKYEVRSTNETGRVETKNQNVEGHKRASLNDLKPEYERAKMPTKENIGGLKEALSAVMQKSNNEVRSTNNEIRPEKKMEAENQNPRNSDIVTRDSTQQKEVPEDVLRKLLNVEEPH